MNAIDTITVPVRTGTQDVPVYAYFGYRFDGQLEQFAVTEAAPDPVAVTHLATRFRFCYINPELIRKHGPQRAGFMAVQFFMTGVDERMVLRQIKEHPKWNK